MAPSSCPRLHVQLHRPRHPLTRLPRPRLQHPPLSATSTSAQGLPPTTRKTSIGSTAIRSAPYMWCAADIYP
jgi:hypothetical protein